LTAEKAGIPAEDFVSPELAVKSAVRVKAFSRGVDYLQLTTVTFPYLIETLDNRGYPSCYYEVNVFEGFHPDMDYEDIYDLFDVSSRDIAVDKMNHTWDVPVEIKLSHAAIREEFDRKSADSSLIPANKKDPYTVASGATIGGFSSTYPSARALAEIIYPASEPDSVTPLINDRGLFFVFGYGEKVLVVQSDVWPPGALPRYFLDFDEFGAYIDPYVRKTPRPLPDNTHALREWRFIDDFIPAGKTVEVDPLFLKGLYEGAFGSD
jgi:hypothetical protein